MAIEALARLNARVATERHEASGRCGWRFDLYSVVLFLQRDFMARACGHQWRLFACENQSSRSESTAVAPRNEMVVYENSLLPAAQRPEAH